MSGTILPKEGKEFLPVLSYYFTLHQWQHKSDTSALYIALLLFTLMSILKLNDNNMLGLSRSEC